MYLILSNGHFSLRNLTESTQIKWPFYIRNFSESHTSDPSLQQEEKIGSCPSKDTQRLLRRTPGGHTGGQTLRRTPRRKLRSTP